MTDKKGKADKCPYCSTGRLLVFKKKIKIKTPVSFPHRLANSVTESQGHQRLKGGWGYSVTRKSSGEQKTNTVGKR